MPTVALMVGYFLAGLSGAVAQKHASNLIAFEGKGTTFALYLLLQSAAACVFFAVTGGFRLAVNAVTLLYAAAFAVLCVASNAVSLTVYRFFRADEVHVVNTVGGLVLTVALGALLFGEHLTVVAAVRCGLMLVAVGLLFLPGASGHGGRRPKLWLLFCLPLLAVSVWLLLKSYAIHPDVVSDAAFCFYTNIFMIAAGALWLGFRAARTRDLTFLRTFRLGRRQIVATLLNVFCSNAVQLVELALLARMDVVLFSPFSTACGVLYGGAVSLLYKEKLNFYTVAAIAISVAAIFVGSF